MAQPPLPWVWQPPSLSHGTFCHRRSYLLSLSLITPGAELGIPSVQSRWTQQGAG